MSVNKLGRYDILRVLGRGAMGVVYEARDPNLDRRVAIKTINVENLSEEAAADYEARFRTEARSAARLQHPNIVSVYDSDRHGDMAFLVMEFIEGQDLKHHLDGGKRYSLEQSMGMMRELLSALAYAHRQGIVHRDVKPANLLIGADGRVKLTDFGVARIEDASDVTRTQGSMVGTLKYMSPEQVQGQPIDARADLFAVGIVFYQLLTGKRPFDGDTDFAIIQQIVGQAPAAPSTFNPLLPPAMDEVLACALAKKREQRFATAQEFTLALQAAGGQASDPTMVFPPSPPGHGGSSTVRMHSSGTGTGATVTQELELVCWKDIRDSGDLADLEGFLDRFPAGIYADLARQRLTKLGGGAAAEEAGHGLVASTGLEKSGWTRLQAHSAQMARIATEPVPDPEATRAALIPAVAVSLAPETVASAVAAPPAALLPEPAQMPALPVSLASPARSSTMPFLALAGVAVLALAGMAYKRLPATSAPAVVASPALAAPAPVAARASVPPSTKVTSVAAKPQAKMPTPAQRAQTPVAADKQRASQPLAAKPAKAEPAMAAAGDPRKACEHRMLLGFQTCLNDACVKPAFSQHAVCVERRAMEKLRREAQELRN